jgi:tol-pal system protein YbgF
MTKDQSRAVMQPGHVRVVARGWAGAGIGVLALPALCSMTLTAALAAEAQNLAPPQPAPPSLSRAVDGTVISGGRSSFPQLAQLLNRPPANVPSDTADNPMYPAPGEPGDAGLLVRIDHLENQIRALNGQIEQLQFQQRRLEEVLRKVQQDTDFRFQELQGRGGLAPAGPAASAIRPPPLPPVAANGATPVSPPGAPAGIGRRGDAFDPSAQPDAPGAPRPLGGAVVAAPGAPGGIAPDDDGPNSPMDLMHPGRPRIALPTPSSEAETAPSTPRGASTAMLSTAPPAAGRDEFETGRGLFRQGQYEAAQNAFSAFLQRSPKDARVADATYWLGETFSQRGRHREAAEQYLKLSTDYPRSPRAPDGLLRLGMSLGALGAKEQACATFQEVGRKYPTASAGVKLGVERELKRTKC